MTISIILGLFFFLLGTIIGSFLNVVALRYNTGRTLGGRSSCYSCNKILSALELVPLFSFIFLGGRCKSCKSKISWQYPLVEFITGLIFLGLYFSLSLHTLYFILPPYFIPIFIYYAIIFCLLIVISIYDLRHKIIPDGLSYAFSLIATFHLFIPSLSSLNIGLPISGWDFLAGPIFFYHFIFSG